MHSPTLKNREQYNNSFDKNNLYNLYYEYYTWFEKKNYEVKRNISDTQLLTLYQESLFQVLPLNTVTASLALLEGCACGLPLISINSENIKFYISNAITYEDYKDLSIKIIETYNNVEKFTPNVDHLSWQNIMKQIAIIIENAK